MGYNIPEHLKLGKVWPFTKSPDFPLVLEDIFQEIRERIKKSGEQYASDYVSVGLPGISNGCIRKSQRLFDYFVLDKVGKDKIEDELLDNVELALYAYAYYKMLEMKETGSVKVLGFLEEKKLSG